MPFLEELMASTRARVAEARSAISEEVLEQRITSQEVPRGFATALSGPDIAVIAEIKRATPLKGPLDLDLDAGELAGAYAAGGAAAISVLTEPERFHGSLEDLEAARRAGLPVLLKDFVVDSFQVFQARATGADAVLVIVRIAPEQVEELTAAISSLGMDALVEVHDERDVDIALGAGARVIGINHRDLDTFEVDTERTAKLRPMIPDDVVVVGLSGVSTRNDVVRLQEAGADAVLIGESLVTAQDPSARLRELRGA
jgi:indole-3-glycerol phosphate synthase